MKVELHDKKIETNVEHRNQEFSVKDPAIMFEILCNRMYQHPLQTSVQEYLCNARDSHREADCADTPIKVILPTEIEPTLVIEDFGVGLSRDRIKDVFIYLGGSTKRDSNLQTGGFGIGAKSGWSYSKSFGITTIHDGDKRVYIAFLGDKGVGQLDLIEEIRTDEPNGTAISLPIEIEDIDSCIYAVHRTIALWDIQPIVKPESQKAKMSPITINKQGVGWKFLTNFPIYSNQIILSMDGVPYPCPAGVDNISKLYMHNDTCLLLEFKTGELEMAVNREAIQVNDTTIETINNRIDDICDQATQTSEKMMRHIKNPDRLRRKSEMLEEQWGFVNSARDIWKKLYIPPKKVEGSKEITIDFNGLPFKMEKFSQSKWRSDHRISLHRGHYTECKIKSSDFVIVNDRFIKRLPTPKIKPWLKNKQRIRRNYIRQNAEDASDSGIVGWNHPLYGIQESAHDFYVLTPLLKHGLENNSDYYKYVYINTNDQPNAPTYKKEDFKDVFNQLKSMGFSLYSEVAAATKTQREKSNGRIQAITYYLGGASENIFHEADALEDSPNTYCYIDKHYLVGNSHSITSCLRSLRKVFGEDNIPKRVLGMHQRNSKRIKASGIPSLSDVLKTYVPKIKGQITYNEWFSDSGYDWRFAFTPDKLKELNLIIDDPDWKDMTQLFQKVVIAKDLTHKRSSAAMEALESLRWIHLSGLPKIRFPQRILDHAKTIRKQEDTYAISITDAFYKKYPLIRKVNRFNDVMSNDQLVRELVIYINAAYKINHLAKKETDQNECELSHERQDDHAYLRRENPFRKSGYRNRR